MPSDPATLLQALWETYANRAQLQEEIKRQASESARSGLRGATGLIATSQLELGRTHLDGVIRSVLNEFERRAARDTATREFLTSGAARQIIAAKLQVDMPMPQVPGSLNPRLLATFAQQRAQHIAYLEHTASAHLQVLAASFARPPPDVPQETVRIGNGGVRTMTREELEKRDALRLSLLHKVFHAAEGSRAQAVDLLRLAPELGRTYDELEEAARYLVDARLLEWLGSGTVYLTPQGVREVEDTIRAPDRPTVHFKVPAIQQVIHFHGQVGVGVQTGGTSTIKQHIGSSTQEILQLLSEIRAALPESATDAREAVDDLREEIAKASPKPSRVKAFAAALWLGAQRIIELAPKVLDLMDRLKLPRP